jgi:hypothetical protein
LKRLASVSTLSNPSLLKIPATSLYPTIRPITVVGGIRRPFNWRSSPSTTLHAAIKAKGSLRNASSTCCRQPATSSRIQMPSRNNRCLKLVRVSCRRRCSQYSTHLRFKNRKMATTNLPSLIRLSRKMNLTNTM